MENKKFVFTYDEKTREQLIELGFIEIQTPARFYMFVNKNKFNFDNNIDVSKLKYTNVMCF